MGLVEGRGSCPYYKRALEPEYDVFLSFRGEDTRYGFTGYLYDALIREGVKAFIDDDGLTRGVQISPDLVKAIEGSRASIVVFSENYASSGWCLDELVNILDCMELRGQLVLPVFYKVYPSVVRNQTGPYEKAMAEHETQSRYNIHKVAQWRSALSLAANLSGWHVEIGYEFQFIQRIVQDVSNRLNRPILYVTSYPVGLESRKSEVISLLGIHEDDVRMVGIYGMGGIGKSTIVRAVYNSIALEFDGASFLSEVRETASQRRGLEALQEKLLGDILGGKNKMELNDVYRGISVIKQRLCDKKILLILDDVNKLEQLEALAGIPAWFGHGSRILITTRDKHLLTAHHVNSVYEVDLLNEVQAMELFSWHAFRKRQADPIYQGITERVVNYAECLPLALEVIGRAFTGRSLEEWEDALDKYKSIPEGDIINKLKISYDELDDFEQRIFLDIACFFNGKDLKYVHGILEASDLNPTIGLKKLVERGLLTIAQVDLLSMHSLIQDMGREIVRRQSPSNVGKRSRLWHHEDVIQVLTNNMGSDEVEGILLDLCHLDRPEEKEWSGDAFEKMKNLRILAIKNACFSAAPTFLPNSLRLLHWESYPSSSFPAGFYPKKLGVLEIPRSHLTLETPFKKFLSLTCLNLSKCGALTNVPDLSGLPNLEELDLSSCRNLVEVHDSVGFLDKLVKLQASNCTELKSLSRGFKLKSLKWLILDGCSKLRSFPEILELMENVVKVDLRMTAIEELPPSFEKLTSLRFLHLGNCERLKCVPLNIGTLQALYVLTFAGNPMIRNAFSRWNDFSALWPLHHFNYFCYLAALDLSNCKLLDEDLPSIPRLFPWVVNLRLCGNHFETIPTCFQEFQRLEVLRLNDCKELREIPDIVVYMPKLQRIYTFNCAALSSQSVDFILEMGKKFQRPRAFCLSFEASSPRYIAVPGLKIPEWIVHRSKGDSISFLARGNFPDIILCISMQLGDCTRTFKFTLSLYINKRELSLTRKNIQSRYNDHSWLFDPMEDGRLKHHMLNNWDGCNSNHVEISFKLSDESHGVSIFAESQPQPIIRECGIYFCEETHIEDICFSSASVDSSKVFNFRASENPKLLVADDASEVEVSVGQHKKRRMECNFNSFADHCCYS